LKIPSTAICRKGISTGLLIAGSGNV